MENVRVYQTHPAAYGEGGMFTYPFGSAVRDISERGVLHHAVLYKLAYLTGAIAISGCAVWRYVRTRSPLDAMAATWLATNTLFALCIGSVWGMRIAQRSTAWAIPAALFVLAWTLPVRWYWRIAWCCLPVPLMYVASQT
jgi:hypothetical protein